MKLYPIRIALTVLMVVLSSAYGADDLPTLSPTTLRVIEVKTDAFARQLVELKLQEVSVQASAPGDAEKLRLLRAQQAALTDEITKIALAPLEARMAHMLTVFSPDHPSITSLKQEMAMTRTALGGK